MRPHSGVSDEMGVRMTLSKWRRFAGLFALMAALTFAIAACGGGDDEGAGATTEAGGGATEKTFPEFKIAFDNGIDYLDPGLAYTVQGWSIMLPVHLGLVTYKLVNGPEGATIIPGLAEDLPEISEDGLSYKFTLRDINYSNGQPVKASDFKNTIKRLYLIDSPGVGFFTGIVGADKFAESKKTSPASSSTTTPRRSRSSSRSLRATSSTSSRRCSARSFRAARRPRISPPRRSRRRART
jgi:peptide/nickel transport system substrate-binding protein